MRDTVQRDARVSVHQNSEGEAKWSMSLSLQVIGADVGGHVLHLLCQLLPVWLIQWEEQDSEDYLGLWFRSGWGKKCLKTQEIDQSCATSRLVNVLRFLHLVARPA